MENKQFFHLCGNGTQSRNFITCETDFQAAFNLIGVCAANTDADVVSFSIEESHPHALLWGTETACLLFKDKYETQYRHFAAATRSNGFELVLDFELYPIGNDENYLKNVAIYTIIQPTKDGKPIMFYDYRWGTGSMYFRGKNYVPVWYFDRQGVIREPQLFSEFNKLEKRAIVHSQSLIIPNDWKICNGLIIPTNYIDPKIFESIYRTHNAFRVFAASSKSREEEMLRKMADYHGSSLDDLEARQLCGDISKQMFGTRDPRRLSSSQRIALAQQLRRLYKMSFRQLSTIIRVNEQDLRLYVKY